MNTSVADAVTPTGVAEDLVVLDSVFDETRTKRKALIKKLEPIIENMDIDASKETSPRLIEVQMQMINTFRSLLGDDEAAAFRRVTSKLKQAEVAATDKYNASVAKLLASVSVSNIRVGTTTEQPDAATSERRLEDAFADRGLEPVADSELKTDPKDV